MIWVAAYCRVSTDLEDQANSFASQQRYFREYIERQPDWSLHAIYADEGISGTSTQKRAAFQRMMCDAQAGKFDLILTKEVSRFSRNILDTIAYTRELKRLGIGVLFVTDGIHSLEPDAELRLGIMASIAQEESRKTSGRVKWGQTRQMERGVVFGRSLLGYRVQNGQMTVEPEEAQTVRLIFEWYGREKKGTSAIAKELETRGYRTHRGNPKWAASHIVKILRNEKYVGDLVQKKTITPDYLTHSKKYNHGEEKMIVLRDHHEPIIERELWEQVQEELKRRERKRGAGKGGSRRYALSGKIRCGQCGSPYVAHRKKRKDGSVRIYWGCGASCGSGRTLRDELAHDMLRQALRSLKMDRAEIVETVTNIVAETIEAEKRGDAGREERLSAALERLSCKRERALDAFLTGTLTVAELQQICDRYDREEAERKAQLIEMRRLQAEREPALITADEVRGQVTEIMALSEKEILPKYLLDCICVAQDRTITLALNHLPQEWTFRLERNP